MEPNKTPQPQPSSQPWYLALGQWYASPQTSTTPPPKRTS